MMSTQIDTLTSFIHIFVQVVRCHKQKIQFEAPMCNNNYIITSNITHLLVSYCHIHIWIAYANSCEIQTQTMHEKCLNNGNKFVDRDHI